MCRSPSEIHSLWQYAGIRKAYIPVLPVNASGGEIPMESINVRSKIIGQIQHMLDHAVIKNRRFLDDESNSQAQPEPARAAKG